MKTFLIIIIFAISINLAADTTFNNNNAVTQKAEIGISTAHPLATDAGNEILSNGGNAFDATVAISAVLAVVEPYSSGIGGGGFWLLHTAKDQQDIMLDGRETAPAKATADMYLDKDGKVIPRLSIDGPLAAGIPGEPAALVWLAENHGNLALSASLKKAIEIARNGFEVDAYYQKMLGFRLEAIRKSPASAKIFLANNEIPEIGTLIKQPDLAKTLEQLAKKGRAGFYQGEVADNLISSVQKAGGIWTKDDLSKYQIKLRKPIKSEYKGMRITSAALPSSGGIVMSEIFNILAGYDLHKLDKETKIHLIAEAMRRAYRDRAEYMGDTDFVDVPIEKLISPLYADGLRQSIRKDKTTPSNSLAPTWKDQSNGTDTTHFSVIDREGNRVAATLSINYPFGSGFTAKGTGVLLNDEMDDFSSKSGSPNVYGLVGAKANAIEPNKRMLSSMSPTFLETEDRLGIIGTPGGSRIITMVVLGSLGFYEGKTAEEIVDMPRFHHQYLPDRIQYEVNALDNDSIRKLEQLGHTTSAHESTWGNMHVVIKDKRSGKITAAADKRGLGKAIP